MVILHSYASLPEGNPYIPPCMEKKHNLMIRLIGFLSAEKMVSCKALKMQPEPRAPGPQMCKLFDKPPS